MTQPTPTPGTRVKIRPGAASAFGRRFPTGGTGIVLELPAPDHMPGPHVYVLPDGDPKHHTLCLRVQDLIPMELTPAVERAATILQREGGEVVVPVTVKMLATALAVEEMTGVLEKHQLGPYMQHPDVDEWGYACMGCDEFMDPGRDAPIDFQMLVHQAAALRASILGSDS